MEQFWTIIAVINNIHSPGSLIRFSSGPFNKKKELFKKCVSCYIWLETDSIKNNDNIKDTVKHGGGGTVVFGMAVTEL